MIRLLQFTDTHLLADPAATVRGVRTQASLAACLAHARRRLGPVVAPREIAIRDDLPKTRSGKIMRRVLKARELGLPAGDLSTLGVDGEPWG